MFGKSGTGKSHFADWLLGHLHRFSSPRPSSLLLLGAKRDDPLSNEFSNRVPTIVIESMNPNHDAPRESINDQFSKWVKRFNVMWHRARDKNCKSADAWKEKAIVKNVVGAFKFR